MRLLNLTLQGFRSFEKKVSIDFSGRRGLIYVTGENKAEPALGRNGVGKSSLFEGLFWMLYGKTSRNLKAGAVATWGSKVKCQGTLAFENNGRHYSLVRHWSPNKLSVSISAGEPRDIDQAELDLLIGFNADLFLHAVYHAQTTKMFMDMGPTEQLALFSDILNLDLWEQASERATSTARDKESRANSLRSSLDRNVGQRRALLAEVDDLEEESLRWYRERYMEACLTVAEIDQHNRAAKLLRKKLEALQEDRDDTLAEAEGRERESYQTFTELQADQRTAKQRFDEILVASRELKRRRKEFEADDELVCSKCGQAIPPKQRDAHFEEEETELAQKAEKAISACEVIDAKVQKAKEKWQAAKDAVTEAKAAAQSSKLAQLKRELESLEIQSQSAGRTLDSLFNFDWDDSKLERRQTELERKDTDIRDDKDALEALIHEVDLYRYWAKGFKEVRLFLVEESLAQLEAETNACLQDLGLEEWSIDFAVEAETKGGTIKKGFSAVILSPHNTEPVPWEAWSGGESQRLRLAMAMGLANLISAQTGIMSNIEIWDEPCQHLSDEGISGLLDALENRASQTGRQIWIVEHHALDFGRFEDVVSIKKTSEGSSLV